MAPLYLGVDAGTSGVRACLIDGEKKGEREKRERERGGESKNKRRTKTTHSLPARGGDLSPSPTCWECTRAGGGDGVPASLLGQRPPDTSQPTPLSPLFSPTGTGAIAAEAKVPYPPTLAGPVDWAAAWRGGLVDALAALPPASLAATAGAAVAGTSASVLLVDAGGDFGAPLAPARLYSDAAPPAAVAALRALAGGGHTAAAPTASAAKAMAWWLEGQEQEADAGSAGLAAALAGAASPAVVSAADWMAALLAGDAARLAWTDDNNALKAGWDPGARRYEPWLASHPVAAWLAPRVVPPGGRTVTVVEQPAPSASSSPAPLLPAGCVVAGGTTDSIAAYVAALGPDSPPTPTAVTSLGSTLALKLASPVRVDDPATGVYSHRLGGTWLVGGASNVGCKALADFFSPQQLGDLSARIDPATPSPCDFYPLPAGTVGERFPVPDPAATPRVTPRPADDAAFLAGLLEGIARVEAAGYARLAALGAPYPARVLTAGGGAANPVWAAMRARVLGVGDVGPAAQGEAAYGAALLARASVVGGEGAGR